MPTNTKDPIAITSDHLGSVLVIGSSSAPASRRYHQGAFDRVPSVKAGAWQRNRFGFSRKVLECWQHSEIMSWSLASVVTEDSTTDDRDPPLHRRPHQGAHRPKSPLGDSHELRGAAPPPRT